MLLDLFLTFFKIGLFTFGGGYGMIAVISDICVEKKKWITDSEMLDITVVAESTPGPIAINCSTYVGYKKKGIVGAIVSTIGVVLPSLVIILVIAKLLENFLDIWWVNNAFKGIKLAVGIVIIDAAIKMIKKLKKEAIPLVFLIISTIVMLVFRCSTIALMLIAALVCVILKAGKKL